jgi:ribonuclease HI
VKGFHGAVYKKLTTEMEAHAFMAGESPVRPSSSGLHSTTVPPAVASTSVLLTSSSSVASHSFPAVASLEEDEDGCDVVYSDGACKGNGKVGSVAGLGVWWGWNDSRQEISF